MDGLELVSFEIISNVGMAKSLAIEAIRECRQGNYTVSKEKLEECNKFMIKAHHSHSELIQKEASGEKVEFSLILMHAEDQMLSAETTMVLANEIVDMYIDLKK
ncbi:PTS lactose/cellobiose transporter subunit IIA [Clostridium intestinale]|jgi:PTS system cellobiose-specific IIA component|uniref:Phosphotransferase system enzyme II, ptcA n=1 Tax=Clostridium intestinale URNW TaxID=1294142 RepID=U2NM09_9CLOT|nr:PTS lactose/cellobiose transporter subunit IIA [Clostridium intestinale]ERK29906.1 phosphotransferase system enzyme II, ptcA [Clostridium intestinale URNW]